MSFLDKPPRLAWPRGQRFVLTPQGSQVESDYREKIVASRVASGRESFDTARTAWASTHRLQPDDGLYLAELAKGPVNLTQVVDSLFDCGKSKSDAITALKRLIESGLVAPHAAPSSSP